MQNSTLGPYAAPVFSPPPYAVAVNALFFASLGIVLVAAFLCMLVKGWIREFDRKLRGIPDLEKRAVIKELREQGLARWRLPEIITILPSLIHISLVLFFIGLALYLLQVHPLPAFLSIAIFGLGVLVYFLSIVVSAIDDFSPFRSMYSRALGALYRRLYPRPIAPFDQSPSSVMALPQTTVEKIREWVSTSIIKYKPLSEHAILEHRSSPLKQIISKTSITILNKIWSPASKRTTSADAKNISTSILLQLDVSHIRPSPHWEFPLAYKSSSPSMKEAEGLAYSVCMIKPEHAERNFAKTMCTVVDVLQQSSDPWLRLVASLTSVWVERAEQELSKGQNSAWFQTLSIAGHKEDILHAISDTRDFSAEQWCFVLVSIYVLCRRNSGSKETCALIEILAGLLQKGVEIGGYERNTHIDFWLYVTMSILDNGVPVQYRLPMSELTLSGWIQGAQDISAYGNGMTRDPENFRRLLELSRKRNLDQSLMRQCLVSILCILVSFIGHSDQQQLRLIDQYLEIITDEMGVMDWDLHVLKPLDTRSYFGVYMAQIVLCLLEGSCSRALHINSSATWLIPIIMREYDLKLLAANAQPMSPILKVIDRAICYPSWVTGLEPRNPWLSLYIHNHACSPSHSEIPLTWCPAGISITSKRLDLYDSGKVTPEMNLITFFLSCPSTSITCRALHWYLHLEENALMSGDTQHLTAIFPNIFCKGLSTNENRKTWLLLVDVLLPRLGSMSRQEKGYFVEVFFGYGSLQGKNQAGEDQSTISVNVPDPVDMPTPMAADGLGWMEDVWTTVLRSFIVHPHLIETYWPGLLGVMHAAYPQSAQLTKWASATSLIPEAAQDMPPEGNLSETRVFIGPQTLEEHLADSAQRVLEVLAELLESGMGLVPAELLNRLIYSPLLLDRHLHHDTSSLCHIRGILDQQALLNLVGPLECF